MADEAAEGARTPGRAAFWQLALRDASIIGVAVLLWSQLADLTADAGFVSDLLGLVLGLGLGVSTFLLHEWGHLLGGLACGSTVHPPERLSSVYLFSFDSRRNSRRQFVIMSLAGFAVTAAAVFVAYGLLPADLLATRVARGSIVLLASLTVFVEIPILGVSLVRTTLPPVETFRPPDDERQAA